MKKIVCSVAMAASIAAMAAMERATPESQGVSSRAILKWIDACERCASTNGFGNGYVHGFVIVRHGRIVAEGSWAPQRTLEYPHMLYSHSKSFTSTAIGFLVDDGKIDLDERVVDILPDKAPAQKGENLRQIRVRDLLTMNTGASRSDAFGSDPRGDWAKTMLANAFERSPGTIFKYDSGATYLLAEIAERKSGMKLMDFLRQRLFEPIGMKSPKSTVSPTGVACGGWGMNMTTRDIARFGQFLLQKGVWEGHRLLSEEWITLASARQTWSGDIKVSSRVIGSGSDWNQGYGFQFWRCRHGAFRADGAAGQLTVVMPDRDAVVSVNAGLGNMQRELDLVWDNLLDAFRDGTLPEDDEARTALERKCASLALPMDDRHHAVFEGMDKAEMRRVDGGWELVKGDHRLMVGDGKWLSTSWVFSNDDIEMLFVNCGKGEIFAAGRLTDGGSLRVSWMMNGGIRHGFFDVGGKPSGK